MYHFSPILADGGAIESDHFAMLSNVFSDERLIKLSQVAEDYQWTQWEDEWIEDPNFFRCFPSCFAAMVA